MLKKFLLALAITTAFYVGYSTAANAWPGVPDRERWYGYFKNQYDPAGHDVMPGGVPASVNTASEFISFIRGKLAAGPGSQNGVGAAFIIQTMIGSARNLPPTAAQVAEWEQRVRYYESRGLISWNTLLSYSVNSYYQDGPVDDAFYYENGTSPTIVFRNPSGGTYAIRRECVNPVGTLTRLDDQPNFRVTGSTQVSDTTLYPGQSVTFRHFLNNVGDAANVTWYARNGLTNVAIRSGTNNIPGNGTNVNVNNETFTVPTNAAFGTQYCRYISFTPALNGGGSGRGSTVCATVVADYEAMPIVTPSTSTAQQNDSVTFTYRIQITGNTRSQGIACRIVGHSPGPGYTPLPQQDVDKNPPLTPQPPTDCLREFPQNSTTVIATENVDIGDLSPGSRVCRTLVIAPKNETGGHRSSAEACVVIAKTPLVHFMGNDVWAGGGMQATRPACNTSAKIQTTAKTLRDGSVAGSGVEYAAFALNRIINFGSANKALVDPAAPFGKTLSFANFDSNNLGFFGAPRHCINDYVARYDKATNDTGIPAAINVSGSGTSVINVSGPRSFSGDVAEGAQKIYLVEGDVSITGDIKYPATYNNQAAIPSLVIIATGNMTVEPNVTQMDGIFVTRGVFSTCNPPSPVLSVSVCERQLVVNGAVLATRMNLLRTHGADGSDDTARKRPAEVFNFNAELYLRNALNGTTNNILRTVDQKDLPPRF